MIRKENMENCGYDCSTFIDVVKLNFYLKHGDWFPNIEKITGTPRIIATNLSYVFDGEKGFDFANIPK